VKRRSGRKEFELKELLHAVQNVQTISSNKNENEIAVKLCNIGLHVDLMRYMELSIVWV
jgi:hypothetical protein